MSIKRLDDDAIRRIAAGEVIERPASVVKELLENALDANASRIEITVNAGGAERIRVSDDGVGMSLEEAELAVEKHTTSKIDDADDLETGITTLGFRGEALHAIGSVAKLTITTKPADGDRASELRVEGGEITDSSPAGRATGTTVEITDLFYNTPARKKFLKTETTEFDHINRIVTRYALANPDVAISLTHNGTETFATTGNGDRRGAILSIYGREVAESMIPVETDHVSGYVSHPETNRSTRDYLSTYVNGRYVTATSLREAVLDAYGRQLAADRYPFAVLFVDLPPGDIDVNVHPRKLEVRFDDTQAVKDTVESAVEGALLEHGLLRSSAPRGKSAPAETNVTPDQRETDSESDVTGSTSGRESTGDSPGEPTAQSTATEVDTGDEASTTVKTDPEVDESADTEAPSDTEETATNGSHARSTTTSDRRFRSAGTQTTLDAGTATATDEFDRLPAMRLLGQLRDTYIVAETDDGLVVIDQHAADERIHYERLRDQLADDPAVQALADPVELELTAREAALFDVYQEPLEAIGFRARRIDDRTLAVDAVPAVIAEPLNPELLRDVLSELIDADQDETGTGAEATTSVDDRIDAIVSDLACHPAITGNTGLSTGSIQSLVTALDDCENPYACPHGRPTVIKIDQAELDERFERDYPGHDHRRRLD